MKYKRHNCILSIINEKEINTQQALLDELRKRGFSITQATLSRDIKELELIKQPVKDGYRYSAAEKKASAYQNGGLQLMTGGILGITCAMHTIVIKTLPGGAPVAASVIDSSDDKRILGTVAGDDTVLVICTSPENAEDCLEKIDKIFKDKKR